MLFSAACFTARSERVQVVIEIGPERNALSTNMPGRCDAAAEVAHEAHLRGEGARADIHVPWVVKLYHVHIVELIGIVHVGLGIRSSFLGRGVRRSTRRPRSRTRTCLAARQART